ncbi:Clavaminate synthase-like protein [Xylariaceae sp. FL1019]|nr:Clavaminate synthase-like protein [Xylariaceae sp. FL1019]
MASARHFQNLPLFPEEDVPVAKIDTISLADLRSLDDTAGQKLFASCKELGFFMLDLTEDEVGKTMVDVIDRLFDISRCLMDLSEEEKMRYFHDIPKSFLGFKPRGVARTEHNQPDRFEWFNIGCDGLTGTGPLQPLPPIMKNNLALLKAFRDFGQDIITLIFDALASRLGISTESFTTLNSPDQVSGTIIRFIKSFASPTEEDMSTSMIHHTDVGTITLLANTLGGLQILKPGGDPMDPKAWQWLQPRPGCLIVNLGDAMVQWTSGALRSNVHRINHAPGSQRFVDRYSLGLFIRPNRDAPMNPLTGDGDKTQLTAWEWEVRKLMGFQREERNGVDKGGESAL